MLPPWDNVYCCCVCMAAAARLCIKRWWRLEGSTCSYYFCLKIVIGMSRRSRMHVKARTLHDNLSVHERFSLLLSELF